MNRLALALTFAVVLAGTSAASAQSTDPIDLNALLARMKTAWQANGKLAEQYTSDELWHNVNYDKNGKKTIDESAKYEHIFLEGLPYRRKVEENGKPLSGKEAAAEQARYDKAVTERRAMKPAQKRLSFHRSYNFMFPLTYLSTLFDNRILRREQLNGRDTLVIDSIPKADAKPANEAERSSLNWKETTWIDLADAMPVQFLTECLTDRKLLKKGSTMQFDFTRIAVAPDVKDAPGQAVWLQSSVTSHGTFKILWMKGSFTTEQTWSNYKRFHVDMRLLEDSVQEVTPAQP